MLDLQYDALGVVEPVRKIETTSQYYDFTCVDGIYDDTIQFGRQFLQET
jgi:hypothetical protein